MRKVIVHVVLCAAAWLPMLAIALAGSAAQPAEQHVILTGMVSCRQCRKIHPDKGWTNSSCTMRCVREGSDFVLVVGKEMYGNKVYKLDGNREMFEKLAGGRATFLGHFEGSRDAFYVENVRGEEKITRTDSRPELGQSYSGSPLSKKLSQP